MNGRRLSSESVSQAEKNGSTSRFFIQNKQNAHTLGMRNLLFILFALFCLFPLAACDVNEMSSLEEISKPYTGEYQCEKLLYGAKDYTDLYEIKLTLEADGSFRLSYRDGHGGEGGYQGQYVYEENIIVFTSKNGAKSVSRGFLYENGIISIELPIGGKLLHAEFST